jgi:hypothetical protein
LRCRATYIDAAFLIRGEIALQEVKRSMKTAEGGKGARKRGMFLHVGSDARAEEQRQDEFKRNEEGEGKGKGERSRSDRKWKESLNRFVSAQYADSFNF